MTDHELDRLIDGAIAGYIPEPAPGLSQRVLARTRRPRPWLLLPAAAIAAGIIAYLAVPPIPVDPVPVDTPRRPTVSAPVVSTAPAIPAPTARPGPTPFRRLPVKVETTLTIPLSSQERQLERLFQTHPEIASQLPAETIVQPLSVPELEFPPLTIEPLESATTDVDE